jgi:hypothetical protein
MTCMIGIAGNIIPAIATTNAIIASIQVQQAINIIISINKNTSTSTTTASTEGDIANAAVPPSSSSPASSSYSSSSSIAAANQIKCSHVYCLRLPTRKGHSLSSLLFISIYLSIHLSIYLSIHLFSYLSIYLSIHLSICLSIHLCNLSKNYVIFFRLLFATMHC